MDFPKNCWLGICSDLPKTLDKEEFHSLIYSKGVEVLYVPLESPPCPMHRKKLEGGTVAFKLFKIQEDLFHKNLDNICSFRFQNIDSDIMFFCAEIYKIIENEDSIEIHLSIESDVVYEQ